MKDQNQAKSTKNDKEPLFYSRVLKSDSLCLVCTTCSKYIKRGEAYLERYYNFNNVCSEDCAQELLTKKGVDKKVTTKPYYGDDA